MDTICSKQEFLNIVERERARTDRTGNDFSIITFNINKVKHAACGENALGDLLMKNTRRSDDIGCVEKNSYAILFPHTSFEKAQKLANRFCSTIIPENLNPQATVFTYPFHGMSYKPTTRMPLWKRIMDIIGAAVGLILLLPVCMLIAVYIKSVSPGPAIFKQRRVGFLGKTFMCFKFRTMHANATTSVHNNYFKKLMVSETRMEKLDNYDPRIIPHGKLLRKSGLDELPQLLNVLVGDMSLIGPRPCIPYEAEQYQQWQLKRFEAVPGITGLWQVNGKNKTTFNAMMRYDIRYALKKNMVMDTAILLKTIPAVIRMVLAGETVKLEKMVNGKACATEECPSVYDAAS
jgi:lipopolysaccharide/colanic/teichoic acid biosynthesis glycosyltransferase